MSENGPGPMWAELSILRRQGIAGMRQNEWLNKLVEANPWMRRYTPCDHPGCTSHITHACEGCGIHWGMTEDGMPFKTTVEDVDHMFTYQAPKPEQIPKYNELREEARKFAQTILRLTPGCPDQTVAIRRVREAVMVANAAIALEK